MIYENVISGAFIYALGALAGQKRSPEEILKDSINFFQQTPTDKKIASDLLADWGGKTFLIEFKSNIKQLPTELEKKGRILLGHQINEDETIRGLSQRCHFIGYGDVQEQSGLSVLDLKFNTYLSILLNDKKQPEGLNQFLEKLSPKGGHGLSKEEFKPYLEYLLKHAELVTKDSSSSAIKERQPVSGLMTCVSPGGKIIHVAYFGYDHLAFLMGQKLDMRLLLQQQISYQQAPTLKKTINPKIDKSQGQDGPKMGF
jgi:hypothetical protein